MLLDYIVVDFIKILCMVKRGVRRYIFKLRLSSKNIGGFANSKQVDNTCG